MPVYRSFLSETCFSALAALSPRTMETTMGSREKPMAIRVSRGLYHSMSPRAPTKAMPTWKVFCSIRT